MRGGPCDLDNEPLGLQRRELPLSSGPHVTFRSTGLIMLDFSRETQGKDFSGETSSFFKGSIIFQIFKHGAGQNREPNGKIQSQSNQNL